MGKIKQNTEGQYPPTPLLVAVTLLLICTATQKGALIRGSVGQQTPPEQGHELHVAQAQERPWGRL